MKTKSYRMKTNPKIFFIALTVGSGVQNTGERITKMFDKYSKDNPGKFMVYLYQNSSTTMTDELIKFKPDIIMLNEHYYRCFIAMLFYKKYNPDTILIYFNHCYPRLIEFPTKPSAEEGIEYGVHTDVFLQSCDLIYNLNHHPSDEPYAYPFRKKTIDIYFPIPREEWHITTPWSKRKRLFMFWGGVFPAKFSEKFIDAIADTDLEVDVYGQIHDENDRHVKYKPYWEKLRRTKQLQVMGKIENNNLLNTVNSYKFFICPHYGTEPFMLTLGEACMAGTIPLMHNDVGRGRAGQNWRAWADNLYIDHSSVDSLIDKMKLLRNVHTDPDYAAVLEKYSYDISEEMSNRLNYDRFKRELFTFIFGKEESK
jgi:hypothetical protein